MSKLCILDPACHIPSLKTLFPESEFFSYEPDLYFKFQSTVHPTKEENRKDYGFDYRTDWNSITSENFDVLFIVAPLLNYFETGIYKLNKIDFMSDKIRTIVKKNSFKMIVVFDIFDYDYDPNTIGCDWDVNFYFKRNFNKNKTYEKNVFPFPYISFMKKCTLGIAMNTQVATLSTTRMNSIFWCGALFHHIDERFNLSINRRAIYNEIKEFLHTYNSLPQEHFYSLLQTYKFGIDLIGVGFPNKRTFEIISSGALLIAMHKDLEWGFDEGDSFSDETLFSTKEEFEEKIKLLLTNESIYEKCLTKQNDIVKKYFNKDWMRSYILKKLNVQL